jgi:NhaP-type Na+/H+ or K+/H+ antiporter
MLSSIFLIGLWQVAAAEDGSKNGGDTGEEDEPQYAVLFPWFVEILGVVVFFMANRYFKLFPYTAVMFLLGTFMGIGVARLNSEDQLSTSIKLWEMINSEVLLLVFLPGLVFNDAYGLNVHLFQVSLYQCLILAFPMVLAGTALVACVAYFVFPYGWSFNLAMTFGSILSATDPVAVSSLLSAVGAPPRLTMLISGESLLNDGRNFVFCQSYWFTLNQCCM